MSKIKLIKNELDHEKETARKKSLDFLANTEVDFIATAVNKKTGLLNTYTIGVSTIEAVYLLEATKVEIFGGLLDG